MGIDSTSFSLLDEDKSVFNISIIGVGRVGCEIISSLPKMQEKNRILISGSTKFNRGKSDIDFINLELSLGPKALSEDLADALVETDLAIIVAGLGGETGSEYSRLVAEVTGSTVAISIGMFSLPFAFEGRLKNSKAIEAYNKLGELLDSTICIENERFFDSSIKNNTLLSSNDIFQESNDYFYAIIKSLLIFSSSPGTINLNFDDFQFVTKNGGYSSAGFGRTENVSDVEAAISSFVKSPAINLSVLGSAKAIFLSIVAGVDIGLDTFSEFGGWIEEYASENATVVVGTSIDPNMSDSLEILALFTGLPKLENPKK